MNIVRKRLEEGKGGGLEKQCRPSTLITLVLSDVLGDPLDLIASGPTVPDTSSWSDVQTILERRLQEGNTLASFLPPNVRDLLRQGIDGTLVEDHEESVPSPSTVVLVGNNESPP